MKALLIAGILLILLGGISLAFRGITYKTDKDVIQVGPVRATAETTKTILVPRLLGGLALAGGTILVVVGASKV